MTMTDDDTLHCYTCDDAIPRDAWCWNLRKGFNLHGSYEDHPNGIRVVLCDDCGSDAAEHSPEPSAHAMVGLEDVLGEYAAFEALHTCRRYGLDIGVVVFEPGTRESVVRDALGDVEEAVGESLHVFEDDDAGREGEWYCFTADTAAGQSIFQRSTEMTDDTDTDTDTDTPAPGSDRALEQGCTCPVVDNAHGEGVAGQYIYAADCPLHGTGGTHYD